MIVFGKLTIQGFGSIVKRTVFDLNQVGLNVIRGNVGVGKTTIPSTLCWALFGITLKDKSQVQTWEELRDSEYIGTLVSIEFTIGDTEYIITRCEGYTGKVYGSKGGNNIFIHKDGKLITNNKKKREQQEEIIKIIGYSFNLFKSSVVFGQKMKKLIEETGADKKKLFEEAFEVLFIEEAKENTKKEHEELSLTYRELRSEQENILEKIDDKEAQYKDAKENEDNFEKDKKERLEEYQDNLQDSNKQLKKLRKKVKPLPDLGEEEKRLEKYEKERLATHIKMSEYKNYMDSLGEYTKKVKKLKKKLTDPKHTKCGECGSKLKGKTLEKVKDKINKDITHYLTKVGKVEDELKAIGEIDTEAIDKKINKYKKIISEYSKNKEIQKNIQKDIKRITEDIEKYKAKISKLEKKKLKKKSNKYKKQIVKLQSKISSTNDTINSISERIDILSWLMTDPLSNRGLKAYLFNNLMGQVNNKLQEYSKLLGFEVEFGIDIDSHHKNFYQAITQDNIIIPYEDLSGGQKQLVDTTVALAIHDIVSNLRPVNIMFLDEPFESLGLEEVEIIEEILAEKAKGKCLYLITHHQSFNPVNANEIVIKRGKDKHTKIN